DGRVHLCGFRADVRRLLRGSDLFVLPTLYEGGCSQALLEAMEEGLACLASGLEGVAEVARDGIDALLVQPGNSAALRMALNRLAGSEGLRMRLGAAAEERVRHYSAETMFRETLSRLERLAERGGSEIAGHDALNRAKADTVSVFGKIMRFLSRTH